MQANRRTAQRGRARAPMRVVTELFSIRMLLLGGAAAAVCLSAGCSRSTPDRPQAALRPPTALRSDPSPTDRTSSRSSPTSMPRSFTDGSSLPKGGDTYKLGSPYRIAGRWYVPTEDPNYDRSGLASWYGADFHGRKTANGETYDMNALTAAHPTLPLPSYAYVTSLKSGRTVLVRINDRGPYAVNRIMDLSRRTAEVLGVADAGIADVRVRYAGRAPLGGDDTAERRYLAIQPWSGSAIAKAPSGVFAGRMGLMR